MLSTYPTHRKTIARALAPVAVLVACLLIGLLVGILGVASEQNRLSDLTHRRLAADLLRARQANLMRTATDYATWDDVGGFLIEKGDEDWADLNLGAWVLRTFGIDLVFVVQPDGQTLYAYRDGARTSLRIEQALTTGLRPLLALARQMSPGSAAVGNVDVEARPALASAAPLVVPGAPPARAAPLLVFVERLDEGLLADLSRAHSLPDLHVDVQPSDERASVPIHTLDGTAIGSLEWTGSDLGRVLLRVTLPIWIVLTLACVLIGLLLHRRLNAAAQLLSISEWRLKHDPLTDLPNRILVSERLGDLCNDLAVTRAETGAGGFALLYLDLDGFKAVNDTRGHDAGDRVLRVVAERIAHLCGPGDLGARLGGDEFAVIFRHGATPSKARARAEALLEAIAQPIGLDDGAQVHVGTTIGVTLAPRDGTGPSQLLRQADDALYRGKRVGKRRVCFFDEIEDRRVRDDRARPIPPG